MKKSSLLGVLAVLVAMAAILFWQPWESEGLEGSGLTPVTFGVVGSPDILDMPYFIALEESYAEERLAVTYVPLGGDALALQALLSGDVDVIAVGHLAVLAAAEQGAPIKAFAAVQNSHDYLLLAAEAIADVEGLRGKTIGIYAPGDITEVLTAALLEKRGVLRKDVRWLAVGGSPERYRALVSRRVDAVPLHADLAFKAVQEEGMSVVASIAEQLPLPMSLVVARASYLEAHPDIGRRLTRALITAARSAVDDEAVFLKVAQEQLSGVNADDIRAVRGHLLDMGVYAVDGGLDAGKIQNAIAVLALAEDRALSLQPSDVLLLGFQEDAVAALGRYGEER